MMQCDYGAELFPRIPRKKRLQRALWPVTHTLARDFLDCAHEFGIQPHARFGQWHQRNHRNALRRRRENPGSCPRCLLPGLLAVEHSDAETSACKLKRDRSADQSATSNGDVKLLHAAILAQLCAGFMPE